MLIGGGYRGRAEADRNRTILDLTGLGRNAQTALDLFPQVTDVRIVRCWAGIEAVTPDQLPVIGAATRAADAWHAFGFSAHGFQLGPVVGELLADLALTGRCRVPIEPFGPTGLPVREGQYEARRLRAPHPSASRKARPGEPESA